MAAWHQHGGKDQQVGTGRPSTQKVGRGAIGRPEHGGQMKSTLRSVKVKEGVKDTSKWSWFCHLVLNGKCLFVVFTH